MWTLNPSGRAKRVQNSRKKSYNGSKNFTIPLELGGPWEGRGSETPFPSIQSLAQSMANKHHLMKK
jgi:hypothetical protein